MVSSVCAFTAALLAVLSVSSHAMPTTSLARDSDNGIVDLSEARAGSRNLLAHAKENTTSPAPAPSHLFTNPSSNVSGASGPAVARNVTSFAAYGTAVNPDNDITGRTNTNGKNSPSGFSCVTFNTGQTVSCENEERPVPACCSSQAASASCLSWDNGGRVSCSTAASPYPACCENRNQPRSLCTVPSGISNSCNNDYPVPGCCDSTLCTVFKSGDSVKCTGSDVARCCPS